MSTERINTNPDIKQFTIGAKAFFPNSVLPVLVYEQALTLPRQKNRAAGIIQQIVWRNGWSNSWRNGIYHFHHYHSNTHECMIIAMGNAEVILGGVRGKKVVLNMGDVIILPAGVAHKCVKSSDDFLCVGSYPQGKNYDMNLGREHELEKSLININKLALPKKDPVFGKEGFLKLYWNDLIK